ncbi:MAG: outer membrane protein transport protein [Acidobacteria bacterium]|nr:outer membrane protein transport protein [Acidobacteriota bacterium]
MLILLNTITSAQGLNFPLGNPTGTGGAGNARTDSDNFFMRNNLAGLTEIPLNDEEENTGIKTKADKGVWRFNGELRALVFKHTRQYTYDGNYPIFANTSLTPNFAGEMTYTSANHRFGFGIGTYQIINHSSRLKLNEPYPNDVINTYDTKINSSDISVGGAIRLHKKLSVGAAFIFGRAFINFEEPNYGFLQKLNADGFGAPGLSVSLHYRPTSFLSFGANYKSKRKYALSGDVKESTGKFSFRPPIEKMKVETELETPTIAEAGLEIKPFRKLLIAADFRFYDYTDTLQYPFYLKKPDGSSAFVYFGPQYLFALDVHSFHIGGKYSLSNKTSIQFGVSTNSNTTNFLRRDIRDLGVVFSGALSRRVGNQWVTAGFGLLPGRTRTEYSFLDNSKDRGFLFSLGIRMKQ